MTNTLLTTPPPRHTGVIALATSAALRGVTIGELHAKRGGRQLEKTRIAAMWAARQAIGHTRSGSYPALGRVFARDHTTVLYSVRKGDQLRRTDPAFVLMSDAILEVLEAQKA